MAKTFVKVYGLHNIFNVSSSGSTLDITSIIQDVSNTVDSDSIVFITSDEDDVQYGYPNNTKYIWTHNELYSTNDASFGINSSSGKYLDISVNGYNVEYGVKIADVSTATSTNNGLASAYGVKSYVDAVNTDEKQQITSTTGKIYLTGTSTTSTTSVGYANVSVYATNGQLNGHEVRVAEKVKQQYNTTTESLDFIFE